MGNPGVRQRALAKHCAVSAVDLATRDKIPVIAGLLRPDGEGLALDIGIGTGYTTYAVFGDRPTACLDLHAPNLLYYRDVVASSGQCAVPLCAAGRATQLPFRDGAFQFVLCSEVLEHLEDDAAAVREMARILAEGGQGVITVPYTGLGFTSFLELLKIKTVHDVPGPEYHVRPGYDERSLGQLLVAHGLEVERVTFYFRLFTRFAADVVSLAHLLYQRVIHRRSAWTWSEVVTAEGGVAFRLYRLVFPLVWTFCRLDRLLGRSRGFGLVVLFRKCAAS